MAALATVCVAAAGQRQNDSFFSAAGAAGPFQSCKMQAERAKKTEFIRTAESLRIQLANIEKDKNVHLYNRKSDSRAEYSVLEELEHKVTVNRKTEKTKILQQLTKIRNNVKRLQQQLEDVKPTSEFVDKLKEMLLEIENAINTFKDEQRQVYEQLLKDEKTVVNELSAFEKKVELWATGSSTTEKVLRLPSARIPVDKALESHLPEEIVEFERFLQQKGGRQGGWDDYDHKNFLKVWTKHKGRLSYMDEALQYLCGRAKEDVEQHDVWYREFLILQDRKKESIKKWKEKHQRDKEENLKKKERSEKIVQRLQYEEDQKQKTEERKRQQAAISAWKKQKAVTSAMEQESQLKLEEEKEKNKLEGCQHQCRMKLLVERNTLQKKEKEEPEKLEKEKREKAEKEENCCRRNY